MKELAAWISSPEAPETVRGKQLRAINLDLLAAGDANAFASRFGALIDEVSQTNKQVILFLDQLQQYVGTNANQDVSRLLIDALHKRQITIIGAETQLAYSNSVESDANLAAMFRKVEVDELSADTEDAGQESFTGEKISSDLQTIIASSKPGERITLVLQARNTDSQELSRLIKRNGGVVVKACPRLAP